MPFGIACALALARRNLQVMLLEAEAAFGSRALGEEVADWLGC